ncbi:DHA2 family efflux MFS transporter permease subunit [Streptomyces sp. NPDC058685]|uniref:DHA2 family efflux MFS transporter permease subunit n=1 Tax=Streptomyces sp. NPDC058685 TaxID=3346598 RepID=UPI00364C3521
MPVTAESTEESTALTTRQRRATLAVLAAAQFTVVLSTSIVNVALPAVRDGVQLTDSGMSWVVNAYGLAFGALLLLGGRAADLLNRRTVLLGGLAVFGAASLAAGLASTPWLLITARAAQGVGAAAMAPAALSLLLVVFPPGDRRGRALAVWGAVSGAGGAAGVVLGGVLTQTLGWRSVFFVTVPIAAAVTAGVGFVVPRTSTERPRARLDLMGALTVTAGLVAVVYALASAGRTGWADRGVVVPLIAGGILLVVFVAVERRHPEPLLPLRVFTVPGLGAAQAAMALLGAVWVGLFFFLPLYQQQVLGDSPLRAGLTQIPLAAANMLGSFLAPRLERRTGRRITTATGLVLSAAGLLWLGQASAGGTFTGDVLGPSIVVGTGLGIAFVQLTGAGVAGVRPADSGVAGGLVNTTRQIGGAVGLAVLSTLAASRTASAQHTHDPVAALNEGYRTAFLVSAAVIATALVLVLITSRRGSSARPSTPAPEGDTVMTENVTVDTEAPVVVRRDITIDAPIAEVWRLHTDIDAWSGWNPDITRAALDGPLAKGAELRWHTHGLDITSTVRHLVPGERIAWGGPAHGIDGIHVWTFEETEGGVRVHTVESWSGEPIDARPEEMRAALEASLTAWLQHLKETAERSAARR